MPNWRHSQACRPFYQRNPNLGVIDIAHRNDRVVMVPETPFADCLTDSCDPQTLIGFAPCMVRGKITTQGNVAQFGICLYESVATATPVMRAM